MRRIRGTRRMALRMTLLRRAGGRRWQGVRARSLARWRRARPGVGAFGYRQGIDGLAEGSAYRVLVDFLWRGRRGLVIRRSRYSVPCRQFDSLPNLRVALVEIRATDEVGVQLYRVRVRNAGRGTAPSPRVSLSVDGSAIDTRDRRALGPGKSWTVDFLGPACRREAKAVVDPGDAIRESSERDNRASMACAGGP